MYTLNDISSMLSVNGSVLFDSENFDRSLGDILGCKPTRQDRPTLEAKRAFVDETFGRDWKIFEFCQERFDSPTLRKYATYAKSNGIEILFAEDFLTEEEIRLGHQFVDMAIKKFLVATSRTDAGVAVVSHDRAYASLLLDMLLERKGRRVAMVGFSEMFHDVYTSVRRHGLEIYDAESDAGLFRNILPRKTRDLVWKHRNGGPISNPIHLPPMQTPAAVPPVEQEKAVARQTLIMATANLARLTGTDVFRSTAVKLEMLRLMTRFSERQLGFGHFSLFLREHSDIVRYLPDHSGGSVCLVYPSQSAA